MRLKKYILLTPVVLFITSCDVASVDELVKDRGLLQLYKLECEALEKKGKSIDIEKCRNVVSASVRIAKESMPGKPGASQNAN